MTAKMMKMKSDMKVRDSLIEPVVQCQHSLRIPHSEEEAVRYLSSKFKKEEAADLKEAFNAKMKDLEVKKKAKESVTAAAGGDTSQNRKSSDSVEAAGRLRAIVGGSPGIATGREDIDIDKELRQLFKSCGGIEQIEEIHSNDRSWRAVINFASLESLLRALELNNTTFCGSPLTIYKERTKRSTFRASVCGFHTDAKELDVQLSLLDHFKGCGEIDCITILSSGFADIDFVSLASLDKALKLDKTEVLDHLVDVDDTYFNLGRFRAEIHGFDTGADDKKVEEGLREHFKDCGIIEEISVGARYACIDFVGRLPLFKALELNNTKVGDHTITVQPGIDFHHSRFRAAVKWSGYIKTRELRSLFEEKCGGIAGILDCGRHEAVIYFTSMKFLEKGLGLDGSVIGDKQTKITVWGAKPACYCCPLTMPS